MEIIQIVMVGLIGMILVVVLRGYSPGMAVIVSLACGVLVFFMVLPMFAEAVGFLRHLGDMAGGLGGYTGLALRVIGVAYIAELGASVCNDANETAIAAKIELGGRVVILVMAMPVIVDIVRIVTGLLP